ncbi:MAG: hypothetical protein E6G67_05350 [Actinobacteria bacterium]|nr:MAG: hypothetical protein E6G67_05350 [Actinomycetota bacterium]
MVIVTASAVPDSPDMTEPAAATPSPAPDSWERPNAPLGTLIFRAGLVTAENLEDALQEGERTGRRLGQVLLQRGLIKQEDLARLLAGQKGLPFITLAERQVDRESGRLLPEEVARMNHAIPVGYKDGIPVVVIEDPTDEFALAAVRNALSREAYFAVATRDEIVEAIDATYGGAAAPPADVSPELALVTPALHEPEPASDSVAEEPEPDPEVPPEAPAAALEPEAASDSTPVETTPVEDAPAEAVPLETEEEAAVVEEPVSPEPELKPLLRTETSAPVVGPAPVLPEPAEPAEPVLLPAPRPTPELDLEPAATAAAAPEAEVPDDAAPAPQERGGVVTEPVPDIVVEVTRNEDQEQVVEVTTSGGQVVRALPEALEPPEPGAADETVGAEDQPFAAVEDRPQTVFAVTVRLANGDRACVGFFAGEGAAIEEAHETVRALTSGGEWPRVQGRFIRPESVVSVDIDEHPLADASS